VVEWFAGRDLQAEHARAVENIEAIVAVEGIDAVLLGPYDLAARLGKMGRIDDPVVIDAIEHVTRTCQTAGVPLGYFSVSAQAIRPCMERGYTMIAAGVDTLLLAGAARRLLEGLRRAEHATGVRSSRPSPRDAPGMGRRARPQATRRVR
jgi:2-keto-3-deoxy-L-rhamnonate aldolase RhmA